MSYENKEYILQFFEGVHEEGNRAELIEVYRKAKAFDLVVEERDSAGRTMASKQSLEQYAVVNAFWNIDEIIVDYESGESNVKK